MLYYLKRLAAGAAALVVVLLAAAVLTPAPKGILVLEYHQVAEHVPEDEWIYNVPPEDFCAQLDYLKAEGYTTISMLDYAKARKGKLTLPEKPVILTFDDGYANNYTELMPILGKYGAKATAYVITNSIGRERYLTWGQIREMQERGIEIGSHTADHQPLTTFDEKARDDQLRLSKLLLEWNGIHTVFTFSYPNGAYDEALPAMLEKNEYLTAVTGDAGLNTMETNPYLMQRVNIPHPRLGLTEFKLRLLKAKVWTLLGIKQHTQHAPEK